jgi:hypothetical protein
MPAGETAGFARLFGREVLDPASARPLYLARLDSEPVGASQALFDSGAVGVYTVATVPWARGRGVGSALTMAPVLEGRGRGFRTAVLHASEMGEPVYRGLGFEPVCRMRVYGRADWDGA